MAHTDWMIRGPEIGSCNCAYGCPCQFNALPTDGTCRAAVGIQIDKGHYGKVKLDGKTASKINSLFIRCVFPACQANSDWSASSLTRRRAEWRVNCRISAKLKRRRVVSLKQPRATAFRALRSCAVWLTRLRPSSARVRRYNAH